MNKILSIFIFLIFLFNYVIKLSANDDTYINSSNIIYKKKKNIVELAENSKINFKDYWSENPGKIIKNNTNSFSLNYSIIKQIIFFSLFYICISMLFFSKKLVNRNINISKIIFVVISIFLYFLLIPKINLNNYRYIFQIITIIIFILVFFQIKQDE